LYLSLVNGDKRLKIIKPPEGQAVESPWKIRGIGTLQNMPNTMKDTIKDITEFMIARGGYYYQWCAGITSDPKKRLFVDHKLDGDRDVWIYRDCGSETTAREVERHFLESGCQESTWIGEPSSTYVYLYKISAHTVE